MFNLEQSIRDWRQQMLAAGIQSTERLDELEGHLREEIERQMKSGLNGHAAFKLAAMKMGQAAELKQEFRKDGLPLETQFVKLVGAAGYTIAAMYSLWILFFLIGRETNFMAKGLGLVAVATTLLSWSQGHKFLPVIANQMTRTLIGLGCCLGGIIWTWLFIVYVLPDMMTRPAGMEMSLNLLLVGFLWGLTATAVLAVIGHGLEKAAGKRSALASL